MGTKIHSLKATVIEARPELGHKKTIGEAPKGEGRMHPSKCLGGIRGHRGEGERPGNSQDLTEGRPSHPGNRDGNHPFPKLDGLAPTHTNQRPPGEKAKISLGELVIRVKTTNLRNQKMGFPKHTKKGNQIYCPKRGINALGEVELLIQSAQYINSDRELLIRSITKNPLNASE